MSQAETSNLQGRMKPGDRVVVCGNNKENGKKGTIVETKTWTYVVSLDFVGKKILLPYDQALKSE